MNEPTVRPWTELSEETRLTTPIFKVNEVRLEHPVRGRDVRFVRIDSPDWINIIPVTSEGDVVLIRQYRAGRNEVCLEIPGGMVDPGEDPRNTAVRELAEETGYVPESVELLGVVSPNPAFMNNRLHLYVARNCRLESQTKFDSNEQIEVVLWPSAKIDELIRSGRIHHALVIAAFHHLSLREPSG